MQRLKVTGFMMTACALALVAGCGGESGATSETGAVQIFVEPEDTIPEGLRAGHGEENIADGWKVTYEQVPGDDRQRARGALGCRGDASAMNRCSCSTSRTPPATRYVLIADFQDVSAVRWDRFGFDLPNAKAGVKTLPPRPRRPTSHLMVEGGYSLFFEGSIEKRGRRVVPAARRRRASPRLGCASAGASRPGRRSTIARPEDGIAGFSGADQRHGRGVSRPSTATTGSSTNITAGVELTKRLGAVHRGQRSRRRRRDDDRRAQAGEGRRCLRRRVQPRRRVGRRPDRDGVRLRGRAGAHARRLPG